MLSLLDGKFNRNEGNFSSGAGTVTEPCPVRERGLEPNRGAAAGAGAATGDRAAVERPRQPVQTRSFGG